MKHSRVLTENEIIASLRHSTIDCLLVEGADDMSVFRLLEESVQISVFSCGGRSTLLKVFERRDEIGNVRCAFFADKDCWLFEGVPEQYKELIVTEGFSIENDIIADSRVEEFYTREEINLYGLIKAEVSKWWAYEIEQHRFNKPCNFGVKVQSLVKGLQGDQPKPFFDAERYEAEMGYSPLNKQTASAIEGNFELYMRGHQLLEIHQYLFSRKKDKRIRRLGGGLLPALFTLGGSPHLRNDISNIIASFS